MRAARFDTFGGPEVLQLNEGNWPHPADDQVLIRVHASSVNGTGLGLRWEEGPIPFSVRRPFTVGLDVAGEAVRGPTCVRAHGCWSTARRAASGRSGCSLPNILGGGYWRGPQGKIGLCAELGGRCRARYPRLSFCLAG
ncbi:hypothetical protein [Deinococcus sp. QL22]|uniref:hypothetical protein n=1 Tax=Deinococcus sp. QL22 TaxID=2939437 RepID=UPI00201817AB|nr:hypothetical protein [Deinococcus sp. QL22]UQN09583.1 hypothetical protein M1R55_25900 [Deinococcus sp. QL22]